MQDIHLNTIQDIHLNTIQDIHLNTIQDFNDYKGMETLHPLVSVIRVDNTEHIKECTLHYGFYAIYLKENKGCKLSCQSRCQTP